MEEEGIRLALTMVTLLVKKNKNKHATLLIQGDGKPGCCASLMLLIALLSALLCLFLQGFDG